MTDASGKAALARTHSKSCRFFGGGSAREASWSAARQRRFGQETGLTAIEELSLTPGSILRGSREGSCDNGLYVLFLIRENRL